MPRIRTIKPDFCTSPSTRRLSRDARLFFLLLLTEANDEGRLVASAKLLAGSLYPHDDDVSATRVNKWLAELEAQGVVALYEVEDVRYAYFVNWAKHQKISHPTASRLPRPPSGENPEPFPNPAGGGPETFPPDLGSGSGKGKGSGSSSASDSGIARNGSGIEEEEIELRREAERRFAARPLNAGKVNDRAAWIRTTMDGIRDERARERATTIDNARAWGITLARTGIDDEDLATTVRERYGDDVELIDAALTAATETRSKLAS